MTRTYSPESGIPFAERNAVVRPEALGRPMAGLPPMLSAVPAFRRNDPGYGPAAGTPEDAYPGISLEDARAIRREEAFRARELADLPDEGELW